ncbi:hypothetical protein HYX16_00625 [Candidatus Woesearchaeota archaeon]|nr:hypothetical protein [Candidatus Woesearchaeota archaeon]
MANELTISIAFIAGLVSFLSPCVLPLVPAFLTYLVGTNYDSKNYRLRIFLNSLFFVLGFAIIFTLLGIALNSFLSAISFTLRNWLSKIGGIIIILFGLYLLKIIKIPFLEKERKFKANAIYLLLSYSLGLGIPFLIVGIFTGEAHNFISKYQKSLKYFNTFVGVILIILGLLVFFNLLPRFSNLEFAANLLNNYS